MSFPSADHWCQDQYLLPSVLVYNQLDDLLVRIVHHFLARQVRVGFAGTGKKQSQKIIHFCNRTYGRAGVLAGRFLINGNNRTQTGDLVHVGTLHLADEASGIRREGLHIPTLALREDRIKG